jgi:GNAT superfamily N-acetyltransferase
VRLLKSLFYHLLEVIRTFQAEGGSAGLARLGEAVRRIFYVQSEYWVVALTLSDQTIRLEPLPGLVMVQVKDKENLDLIASLATSADRVRFYQMFARGSFAFMARQDDRLVGWVWASDQIETHLNRSHTPLCSGDVCLHDLLVLPAYRGQGIGQRLVADRLQFFLGQGYKRSVASIAKENIASLTVVKKAGYIRIGESYHTRFLFWNRFEYKPFEAEQKYRLQALGQFQRNN